MSMYSELIGVIHTLKAYCTGANESTDQDNDNPDLSITHFYKTEFYNEGWMLKLALSKMLEFDEDKFKGDLSIIRKALANGWASEGRLSPAFTNEHSTHADAILGNIEISSKTKWRVEPQKKNGLFVVIEAKLGSALSPGVKSDKKFDQASRTLACMATAMLKAKFEGEAHFFVIMPERDKRFSVLDKLLNKEKGECFKGKASREETNEKHKLKLENRNQIEEFKNCVERITCHLLDWGKISDQLNDHALTTFYTEALSANGLKR